MIQISLRSSAILAAIALPTLAYAQQPPQPWHFAVSGDSRNCGDIIMPAIARKVQAGDADFYWHLGDFRLGSDIDQDMLAAHGGKVSVADYQSHALLDFANQQLVPFGSTPVFLGLGNHEMIAHTRAEVLLQLADWFDTPVIRAQRLSDDPTDHTVHSYYHWREQNVDFITLDNASAEMFDPAQMKWIQDLIKHDAADPAIRTIVVGMHEAFPDSITAGHSMNENPIETITGRQVYAELLDFHKTTGKEVQVIASHSHFVLADPYNTSCRKPEDVLPGWIVGSAGAMRYALPKSTAGSSFAQTDVYGFLIGAVDPDGHIIFTFHDVQLSDVPAATRKLYGDDAVTQCFIANRNSYQPDGPSCPIPEPK